MSRKNFSPSAPADGYSKVDSTWNCGCNDTKFSLGKFNSRSKIKLTHVILGRWLMKVKQIETKYKEKATIQYFSNKKWRNWTLNELLKLSATTDSDIPHSPRYNTNNSNTGLSKINKALQNTFWIEPFTAFCKKKNPETNHWRKYHPKQSKYKTIKQQIWRESTPCKSGIRSLCCLHVQNIFIS